MYFTLHKLCHLCSRFKKKMLYAYKFASGRRAWSGRSSLALPKSDVLWRRRFTLKWQPFKQRTENGGKKHNTEMTRALSSIFNAFCPPNNFLLLFPWSRIALFNQNFLPSICRCDASSGNIMTALKAIVRSFSGGTRIKIEYRIIDWYTAAALALYLENKPLSRHGDRLTILLFSIRMLSQQAD